MLREKVKTAAVDVVIYSVAATVIVGVVGYWMYQDVKKKLSQ